VQASYEEKKNSITLKITNMTTPAAKIRVLDKYTRTSIDKKLEAGDAVTKSWSLKRFFGWYDLVITVEDDSNFEYRFAGHLETGEDSVSDPAMAGLLDSSNIPGRSEESNNED
jgi:phospholipase C